MLDPLSKKILRYMCAQPNPSKRTYNFATDLDNVAKAIGVDNEIVRAAVRYLTDREYIQYMKDQKGRNIAFYLDYKGLQWKEFRGQERLIYALEKWPEIFAVVVSVLSFITSVVALCKA